MQVSSPLYVNGDMVFAADGQRSYSSLRYGERHVENNGEIDGTKCPKPTPLGMGLLDVGGTLDLQKNSNAVGDSASASRIPVRAHRRAL